MDKYPLDRTFETTGEWFLPDRPDRVTAGTLRYSPEQYTALEVHDAFTELRPGPLRTGGRYPLICGNTRDGQAVTLVNADSFGFTMHLSTGGFRHGERLLSTLVLVGAHYAQEPRFRTMSMRVPGLQVWHARQRIEISHSLPNSPEGFAVSYRIPQPKKEMIRLDSIAANLEFGFSYSANMDVFSAVAATISAWVTITADEPQNTDWFLRQHRILSTMFGLIAGTPLSPDCVEVTEAGDGQDAGGLALLVNLRDRQSCMYKDVHDFFMTRAGIEVDLFALLTRWFEVFPKVQAPSQLASSIFASEKLWLHVEFLSLMQALEGFHRAICKGLYMEPSAYEIVQGLLKQAIPDTVSDGHRSALKSKIKYGNEISLGKRLDDLVSRLSEPIRMAILGPLGRVPREWIDTRNYYTHWDKELETGALDGGAMYEANVRLGVLLRVLYLDLIGIPASAIEKALAGGSKAAQHLMQLNSQEVRP